MNIKIAATKTLEFIDEWPVGMIEEWEAKMLPESLTFFHACEMLKKIRDSEVENEKAHRWLGWAQCLLVTNGLGCLDIMKQINHDA